MPFSYQGPRHMRGLVTTTSAVETSAAPCPQVTPLLFLWADLTSGDFLAFPLLLDFLFCHFHVIVVLFLLDHEVDDRTIRRRRTKIANITTNNL